MIIVNRSIAVTIITLPEYADNNKGDIFRTTASGEADGPETVAIDASSSKEAASASTFQPARGSVHIATVLKS